MNKEETRYRGFPSEETFDRESFLSPSLDYSPVYTWMWNDRITEEGIDSRLDEMQALGIRRFYILPMPKTFRPTSFPTPLEPDYLSDAFLDLCRYAVKQAKARGMKVWLYDEGGWPSGSACGQVMLADPSLVAEYITAEDRLLKKGESYHPTQETEAAFLGEKRLHEGDAFLEDTTITEYRRVNTSFPCIRSADLPDITKRGATELFLELTHERYVSRLAEEFGETITALFTDEPTAPRPFPYNDEIKASFLSHFGDPIEGYLPLLMGRIEPTEETAKIKIGFFDMMSELFCERVLEKESEWAHAKGISLVGHLDKDDEANGSMTGGNFGLLRALRRFDVPGVDAIRRQIFPPKGKKGLYGENKFFPRLASSAAAQTGGRHALTESFAVYGNGLTYDEMRYVLNFQAMRGINLFNMMIFPYGRKGYAQAGLLPHFTQELFPDLPDFNLYLSRLSYLFCLGERIADVALYDPIEEGFLDGEKALAEYEAAGRLLEKKGIPFDIVDDEFLITADPLALHSGVFALGKAKYHTILLPACEHLSDCASEALRTFLTHGGTVLTSSEALARELGATYSPDFSHLTSPRPVADEAISYAESALSEGKLAFLMNESGDDKILTLQAEDKTPYLIYPSDGTIRSLPTAKGDITLTLLSGEIVALLYTDRKIPSEMLLSTNKSFPLLRWTYRPTERLVIGERATRIPLSEKERPLKNKENPFRDDFSGSILYKTHFSLPKGTRKAFLDLGRVICSAEVSLNGYSLGKRIMPPYRFEIPIDRLYGENELTLLVTNTAANEYEHTDAFHSFRPWQLGNYIKEERAFHRESLAGGLLDEAKIFYE